VNKSFVFDEKFASLVEQRKVTPSEILIKSSGANFVFSDRNQSMGMLASCSQDRFHAWIHNDQDRNLHPIPFLADGPGSGKSRFLQELRTSFKNHIMEGDYSEEFKDVMNDALYINVTFGNGSIYKPEESGIGVEKSLALRMMFQFQDEYKQFNAFLRNRKDYMIDLGLILDELYTYTKCVVLGIDEVNRVYDVEPKKLKELLNAIGGSCCSSSCFFVPVVAGTVIGPLSEYVTKSTHPPLPIPLPLLSFESSKTILSTKDQSIANMIQNYPEMSTLIADIGGHCRALEILFDSLRKFSRNVPGYFDNVINCVEVELEGRYSVSNIPLGAAIALSVLGVSVGINTEYPDAKALKFQDLEEKGFVKIENKKLKVPYVFICCFLKRTPNIPYAKFWNELLITGNIWWQDWEVFNRNYLVFRLSLYRYLGYESITLRQLFNGAKTSLPKDVDIGIKVPSNNQLRITSAKQRFPSNNGNNPFSVGEGVLNAAGAPFDAFMYLETGGIGNLLVALQMKLANNDSRSPQVINDNKINEEWNKINKTISSNLNGTDCVCVILGRCEASFDENGLSGKCFVISKNEYKDYYGELYYHRIQ
jgi:hypothetical protein